MAQKQSRVVEIEGTKISLTNDGDRLSVDDVSTGTVITFDVNDETVADIVWLVTGNKRRVPRKGQAEKAKATNGKAKAVTAA